MSDATPLKQPILERTGLQFFRWRSRAMPKVEAMDAVHYLNPNERRALRRVQNAAIVRAALAGAISAIAAAVAEVIMAQPVLGPEAAATPGSRMLEFWAVVGGVTVVASIVEMAFLYWDALRSTHELARVAGLEMFPEPSSVEHGDGGAVAAAMARAALELPNPFASPFGVNPRREVSRLRLLLASLLYKAKVGLTNFLVKALVRRMLGRVAVRSVLPFVAVPITAAWNAVVTWRVLREARIRAMGPSAAHDVVSLLITDPLGMSPAARIAAVRAVASTIVRKQDLHPNLMAMLIEVRRRCGEPEIDEVDDPRAVLAALETLVPSEQAMVTRVLGAAAIIDGRLQARERRLFVDALTRIGRPVDLQPLEALRRAFVNGDGLTAEHIAQLA